MDEMFGGAIQIVDKTLRALSMGVQRLFYHQGTVNQGTSPSSYSLTPSTAHLTTLSVL